MKPFVQWPLDKNQIRRKDKTSLFGMVRRNADGSPRAHQGWDFFAEAGTKCYSVCDGVVTFVGSEKNYGNFVVIKLDYFPSVFAFYGHLDKALVAPGNKIKKGAVVGTTGTTGNAQGMTGADQHLHFEFRSISMPGLGLGGRIDPFEIFKAIPLNEAAYLPE